MPVRATDVGCHLGVASARQGSAEIWYAWVGDHAADIERFSRDLLSDVEQAHLTGYRVRDAAERYVVTRSLVRAVLGERLEIAPRSIQVSRTDTGKPVITQGVHFNVSHSGDLILMALSDARPVGVDIERKRDVQRVDALLRRWLSDEEQTEFMSLHHRGASASEAFLRLWSLKEARLKALGVGISGASGARLDLVEAFSLDDLLQRLADQRPDPGYVGAIAFA
jgi:4'-phosphopantetheinyl transferase